MLKVIASGMSRTCRACVFAITTGSQLVSEAARARTGNPVRRTVTARGFVNISTRWRVNS